MSGYRKIKYVGEPVPTMEGAGVRLKRVFGRADPDLDPFLLLDDFGSGNPEDYMAGFPWHPHRGIETITYVLDGKVAHGDSLGNKGVIGAGDVQWMTAGSGIIHEEMPQRSEQLTGYQLWANLPAAHKMTEPRYRDVSSESIPSANVADGVEVKIICGKLGDVSGPVQDIIIEPQYLDVSMQAGAEFLLPVPEKHNVFAYITEGKGSFGQEQKTIKGKSLVVFGEGDEVFVRTGQASARFLLISGKPLNEPVAWRGPIVMNTDEELRTAFEEYHNGTFIKHKT